MHRRNYTSANGSYRFGFNGQEKDDEIYGDGNMNSAQYWEYDTRLGRRWNLDPEVKSWQSRYACFSNNPISRIDPDGDDDYFDQNGKYIGSSISGTKVRIVNTLNIEKINGFYVPTKTGINLVNPKVGEANSMMLSSFISSKKISSNQKAKAVLNILNKYADDENITGDIGVYADLGPSLANTSSAKKISFNLFQKKLLWINNYSNIKSVLFHEKGHQDEKPTNNPYDDHANIYYNQINGDDFKTTDSDFQLNSVISGFCQYGMNSYNKGEKGSVLSRISKINSSNLGFTLTPVFDNKTHKIKSMIITKDNESYSVDYKVLSSPN